MQQHPLAPNDIIVEKDPDGDIRTYAKMGEWTIETKKFARAMYCSDVHDEQAAYHYRDIWLRTGIEPDPDKCYDPHAYPYLEDFTSGLIPGPGVKKDQAPRPLLLRLWCQHQEWLQTLPCRRSRRNPTMKDPGNRNLAERLLFEHGLSPNFREDLEPEVVEIMAATGRLETYRPGFCPVCDAAPNEGCDAGLHS